MALDYSALKSIARKCNLSPKEVIALSPGNDPFYCGAPGQVEKGKWFAEVYCLMGKPENCHIRRVHYWLMTTKALPKPNGEPYENTQNDWCLLTLSAKYARYLGLVPIENIVDRRNPDPEVNFQFWPSKSPNKVRDDFEVDSLIQDIVDRFHCFNPSEYQPCMLEVWAEKSTMNDVLKPLCQQYGMNLVTGLGELSITAVHQLAGRIADCKKPVRIFYVSDFDPCGESMPVSVSRKIEYFVRQYKELDRQDVKLIPVLLSYEQCQKYSLPRAPIKNPRNDHKGYKTRKAKFEDSYGKGATELDAMEALYPGEMKRIIEEAILPFFDVEAWNGSVRVNREIQERVREYLVGRECDDCDGSGWINEDEDLICITCNGRGRIDSKLRDDILSKLEFGIFTTQRDGELVTGPVEIIMKRVEKKDKTASECLWLYDSSKEYIDQLDRYKQFRGGQKVDIDSNGGGVDLELFEEE